MKQRLNEIDALRGLAVFLMILFHAAYNATAFAWIELDLWGGAMWWFWLLTVSVFLGLLGVSIWLSDRNFLFQLKRGAGVFACGLLITTVTFVFVPSERILFGILHCAGIAIPFTRIFKGRPIGALLFAVGIFLVGLWAMRTPVESPFLFPLGFTRPDFFSADYYPLFPYLAIPLVGVVFGQVVYPKKQPLFSQLPRIPLLSFLGQNSLLVYLLHQPILYAIFLGIEHWLL